jgi:ABC-type nitrate/sulfonate/bicarbonate transport system substrate-binding protein
MNEHDSSTSIVPVERRRVLVGAAAAAGLLLGGRPLLAARHVAASGDLTNVRFQLDWITNAQFAGWYLADDAGDFADEGLELSLLPGADVASHEAVLAGGGADFAMSSYLSRLVDAVNAGAEIVAVGATFQRSPAGLMSNPETPVKTPEDILGKRIGIQEGGQNEIDTILTIAGLPLDYTAVPVGFDPTPLAEGVVDAYYCYVTSQPLTFDAEGIPYELVTFEELGGPQYGGLVCVTRDYLDSQRDLVVGFMRASVKGWERAIADPAAGSALTVERYGVDLALDPEVEDAILVAQLPLLQSDLTAEQGLFRIDPEFTAGPMYDALRASGREDLPDVATIIDATVLDEVFGDSATLLS